QRVRFEHPEVAALVITGVSGGEPTDLRRTPANGPATNCGLQILVDRAASPESSAETRERALAAAGHAGRGPEAEAVRLSPLWPEEFEGGFAYPNVRVEVDERAGVATLTIVGPPNNECFAPDPGPRRLRSRWWPLAVCRELDDALLLLGNHPRAGRLVVRTEGDPLAVASADVALTSGYGLDWFVTEVVLYWRRMLERLDEAGRSLAAFLEPGSCFVGTLLEVALAAGRVSLVGCAEIGAVDDGAADILLTGMNFGPLPMASGLTRLESRVPGGQEQLGCLAQRVGDPISAAEAVDLGVFGRQAWGTSGTSR
ncbi:MAG TPA: hypothetical protein VEG38_11255, partial [Acidimicrobiia bacterium]|nr:hypothetical protein [Acidimicrobiia bacterium]